MINEGWEETWDSRFHKGAEDKNKATREMKMKLKQVLKTVDK